MVVVSNGRFLIHDDTPCGATLSGIVICIQVSGHIYHTHRQNTLKAAETENGMRQLKNIPSRAIFLRKKLRTRAAIPIVTCALVRLLSVSFDRTSALSAIYM